MFLELGEVCGYVVCGGVVDYYVVIDVVEVVVLVEVVILIVVFIGDVDGVVY